MEQECLNILEAVWKRVGDSKGTGWGQFDDNVMVVWVESGDGLGQVIDSLESLGQFADCWVKV